MQGPPVVLSIAGSDCCAGAGLQADLKTCAAMGVHCLTAVTAVVAETPVEVTAIEPVPPGMVATQVRLLLDSYPVSAIKTGMLVSAEHIEALVQVLAGCKAPLVVDPVMVASTGDSLVSGSVLEAYRRRLLPLAHLITPNIPEAHALLGSEQSRNLTPRDLAEALAERFEVGVFLTGGHAPECAQASDILVLEGTTHVLSSDWIDCPSAHGTGCTLSAALAAALASGSSLPKAAQQAKEFVSHALRTHYRWPESPEILALNQLPPRNLSHQGD